MPTLKKASTSVAIVDDHSLFRDALSNLIKEIETSNKSPLHVIIEAENGKDFIAKLLKTPQPPDIVVLDIQMPEMNGLETIRWINSHYPKIKVLILTMHTNPSMVATFMKEGAAGYLTKNATKDKIRMALQSIASQGFFYDDFVTSCLIETLKKINYSTQEAYSGSAVLATKALTKREIEFLEYLGSELTYKDIAEKMGISLRTVDGFREELFRKINVNSRVGLVKYAIKEKIINV